MTRPVIRPELTKADKFIEILAVGLLLSLFILPAWYYPLLPERIPRHYGIDGQPDAYSGKWIIWTLPLLGLIIYAGLTILNRFPHIFNYPQTITNENAGKQYKIATQLLRLLKAILLAIFVYLIISTIQSALGNRDGLGFWFLPLFLVLIFGTLGYYIYQMMKK